MKSANRERVLKFFFLVHKLKKEFSNFAADSLAKVFTFLYSLVLFTKRKLRIRQDNNFLRFIHT